MDSDLCACQICEASHRPLTCAACLQQPGKFGQGWARLRDLQAQRELKQRRLDAELRRQVSRQLW